jgi:hypothetical protein
LAEAVRAAYPESSEGRWEELEVEDPTDRSPARQVADRFVYPSPNGPVGPSFLAEDESFSDKVVWLRGLSPNNWQSWADFLAEYAHDVKARPLVGRSVFIAPVQAPPPRLIAPTRDVALAVNRWSGVIDPLDQLMFVSQAVRSSKTPRLQKNVAVAVAAGLALWDPEAGTRLVERGLDVVLKPHDILRTVAQERGWALLPENPLERWAEGLEDTFGGAPRQHSAALAVLARNGRTSALEELERRVWQAQVGVLFPFVEQARRELVEALDGELRGPFRMSNGATVNSIKDLEIGQIHYHLIERGRTIPTGLELLKDIRNRLAHLQMVSAETLRHPDLGDDRVLKPWRRERSRATQGGS